MGSVTVSTLEEQTISLDPYQEALRDRARRFEDDADPYLRGLVATEVYRDHSDWPVVLKRAEIIARTMERLEPVILPEERIVGPAYRRFQVHRGVSDEDTWRLHALYPEMHGFSEDLPAPEGVKQELRWWQDRPLRAGTANTVRMSNSWLSRYALASPTGFLHTHTLPDHGILLGTGIDVLRQHIAVCLAGSPTAAQRDQYLAMDRCLEGLAAQALRCAQAARCQADQVGDPWLRQRLATAARNCQAIAGQAPASFAQALQLLYLSNMVDRMDNHGDAASYGRIDQLLWPFYEADLRAGALTPDEAAALVCDMVIKCWSCQASFNMTIGGLAPEGDDATNDLSYMFLRALETTEMAVDLSVRLHRHSPGEFVRTVARVLRLGLGRPGVYNDEVTIPALTRKGVALEDARDYAPLGCVEVMIPGRTPYRTMGMSMNLPKVLELTLNRGQCLVTGETVWDDVPAQFETWDGLLQEYRERVRQIIALGAEIIREDERIESTLLPRPWLTVLSRGGIKSGVDMTAGQPKYDAVGVTLDGIADIVNSLYVIKKLAYDEQRLPLDGLRDILRADWAGHEPLRQYVLQRLPRYGQDDPAISALAREEAAHYARCFESERTYYGGRFWPMIFGVSPSLLHHASPKTGATASGRRRGEMLAQSLQPSPAGPQGCTTALLRAVTEIDFSDFPGGISNVQECDPSLVQGEAGLDRLVDLLRGFFELGGMEISLNFLTEEQLRAAQADPERHRYLMVRVFGLSAQFIDLSPELQQTIIDRVAAASRRPAP
jgi:pyruvate-formate lyase